jgi:pimeloyl-ACP methyl ester carboxylesterase
MIKSKIVSIISVLLLITGCGVTKPEAFDSIEKYTQQELKWRGCYENYQCAKLLVPIDYQNLSTGSFKLALLRHEALDESRKIGSLVVNPGGPGSSGVNYAYNAEYIVSPRILERYDIVGFDPRGVGQSAPIKCLTDTETDESFAADSKPDSAAELALIVSDMRDYFAKCAEKTEHLNHYSTLESAQDMDILRSALGDSKLNFLGKSYGTYLGTLYADLYPTKVGRFVLDGAVDPNSSNREALLGQAIGFDNALAAFITECFKRDDCPFVGNLESAKSEVLALLTKSAIKPLISKSGRVVTESLIVVAMASALYDNESGWPVLREAFTESINSNGDSFLLLADQYAGRTEDGTYYSNENDALQVIDCLDRNKIESVASIKNGVSEFATKSPIFGPYLAYSGLACRYFPKLAESKESVITKIVSGPVLVIGTTRDPATPYKWAQTLAKIFTAATLISLDGDGHTGHGRGSKCVDSVVDRYLLTGVSPTEALFCAK